MPGFSRSCLFRNSCQWAVLVLSQGKSIVLFLGSVDAPVGGREHIRIKSSVVSVFYIRKVFLFHLSQGAVAMWKDQICSSRRACPHLYLLPFQAESVEIDDVTDRLCTTASCLGSGFYISSLDVFYCLIIRLYLYSFSKLPYWSFI